jgi:hypothetical protein
VRSSSAGTAARVAALRARADVAALLGEAPLPAPESPVLDVAFAVDGRELRFFSVISTIGTPIDVTAQELRLEAFFPSDAATRAAWSALTGEDRPS